jgi:hypothetical protein
MALAMPPMGLARPVTPRRDFSVVSQASHIARCAQQQREIRHL